MGERAPLPLVLASLNDEVWSVRESAVVAIGELKITAARDSLLAMLNNGREHQSVQVAALKALTNLEEDGGISILLNALNDPVENVRTAAAGNMARGTTSSLAEQLLTTASEHIAWIRLAAVTILGKLGMHAPIDLLLALLNDENKADVVRTAAGRALIDLGDVVPIKVMRTILQYKDIRIRQGIAEKLSDWNVLAFTEDIPVVSLLLALEHEDQHVRQRAANKLAYD